MGGNSAPIAALGALARRAIKLGLEGADHAGLLDEALALRRRLGRPRLTILCYHRVSDEDPARVGMRRLVCTSPAQLDGHMAAFSRHYETLTLAEVGARLASRRPLPANLGVVTFDDGYRDNVEVALPVLQRRGVVGTFFVVAGYVDGTTAPWLDRVSYALLHHPGPEVELPAAAWRRSLEGVTDRHPLEMALVARLKALPWDTLRRAVDQLEAQAGAALPEALWRQAVLTAEQLAALPGQGMEVGNHSMTHCTLRPLGTSAGLWRETAEARARLEAISGAPVTTYAYPHGGVHFDAAAVAAVRHSGHTLAVDARDEDHGVNPLHRLVPYRLRRMSLTSLTMPLSAFKARLAFADLPDAVRAALSRRARPAAEGDLADGARTERP